MKEALKLALEALQNSSSDWAHQVKAHQQAIAAIEAVLAQPEQEPVAWRLVPIEPTEEMLKAMDECSTEGYDERLYAGHAASVYMAAVDVAPSPPQPKEPEQSTTCGEPVAWMVYTLDGTSVCVTDNPADFTPEHRALPLYTTPPQRTAAVGEDTRRAWVGLTDKQLNIIGSRWHLNLLGADEKAELFAFARAVEAAHGIKENT